MRRRFTDDDRQRFYTELERSGDSVWSVAERIGIGHTTAYRWLERRKGKGPVFAKVVRSRPETQRSAIAVEVGAARVVVGPGFDPDLLRAVVDALSGGDQ